MNTTNALLIGLGAILGYAVGDSARQPIIGSAIGAAAGFVLSGQLSYNQAGQLVTSQGPIPPNSYGPTGSITGY